MRFLLNEGKNRHLDQRMLTDLGEALWYAGHEAFVINKPQKDRNAEFYQGMDVIIEINHPRDEFVPTKAIHIAWIQDYILEEYKASYDDCCLPQDIIYTFGDGPLIGVPSDEWQHYRGSLLTAVDEYLFDIPISEPYIDMSLVGFIPGPLKEWMPQEGPVATIAKEFMRTMDRYYRPLTGHLDPQAMMVKLRESLRSLLNDRQSGHLFDGLWEPGKVHAGEFIQEYARLLDRWNIAKLMLSVSANVTFRGRNWERWPEFADWSHPNTENPSMLLWDYKRSRINVHNNPSGFALHNRVFEAMAVGGFIMSHKTPHVGKAGQITEYFEPNVHYGEYTVEDFYQTANYWLANKAKRQQAAELARKIVKDKHLWKHRAAQILKDLRQ